MEERFQLFTTLVANINRCIKKIKTEEMSQFNLKSVHVSCIYYLYKSDALTVKELCDVCEEDKANISRAVEHLETCAYVMPRPSGSKRYKAPIKLTEQGEEVAQIICDKVNSVLRKASVGVSDEEREVLYRTLGAISDNLLAICEDYDI
ncbi:MAG: winged helix-turn-helix transcriptional regulator [Ruminococcaceae bacterium]|nr:winged helix-turn-helix transcriptional regulator [Oscillospiraceae bacterium]